MKAAVAAAARALARPRRGLPLVRPISLDLSRVALSNLTGGRERIKWNAEALKGHKGLIMPDTQMCTQSKQWEGCKCKLCRAHSMDVIRSLCRPRGPDCVL